MSEEKVYPVSQTTVFSDGTETTVEYKPIEEVNEDEIDTEIAQTAEETVETPKDENGDPIDPLSKKEAEEAPVDSVEETA